MCDEAGQHNALRAGMAVTTAGLLAVPPQGPLPPAVMVNDLASMIGLLAVADPARGICFVSLPGAAGSMGGLAWKAMLVAAAPHAAPGLNWCALLDCGTAPGLALAALRDGLGGLILAECAGRARLQAIATAAGAVLLPEMPPVLDLSRAAGYPLRHAPGSSLDAWLKDTKSTPPLP